MNVFKKISTTIFAICLVFTVASAQARYKHVPRVKVDINRTEQAIEKQEKKNPSLPANITTGYMSADMEKTNPSVDETTVASSSPEEVIVPNTPVKTVVKEVKTTHANKKTDRQLFTQKVKEDSKWLKVKEAKKTHANVPLILLIIFYVLAFIFILIAIIMLLSTTFYDFTLFLVFLILGITFALAASILLTLMKLGVF